MGAISPIHILIVVVVLFLLFGAKKLPELGKSTGSGIREFKKGLSELHADAPADEPKPAAQTAAQPPAAASEATAPASTTTTTP